MDNRFFEKPVLNSPYEYPSQHWELDDDGQPTQQIINRRRWAAFITPVPKPKKRRKKAPEQRQFTFDEGMGLSTEEQQYDPTPIINELRREIDAIECGIVKLPRVPVADNIPGEDMPKFRNLWEHIRARMPKKGRGKAKTLDPLSLPVELQTALEALYGHYEETYNL